jgi:serine/threonine-protein kinase
MEYVDGLPLNEVMKEKVRLPGKKCLDLVLQTARGLQAALECGSIHRDIKPENLMMTQDGRIKIVDFGLAKNDKIDSFKTATGIVMGTPHYISPEQASGMPVDHRSDIYSLGATLYHLLAGRPPFDGDSAFSILHKQIHAEVRSLTQWNPGVPDAVCQMVYRMLAKHPDARYQTYGHLIRVLEDLLSGRDRPSLTMEAVDESRLEADRLRAQQDRKRMMVAGAILAMVAAAALGALLSQPSSEDAGLDANTPGVAQTRIVEPEKWKSTTFPLIQDIRTQVNEMDEAERNFSRRANTQDSR